MSTPTHVVSAGADLFADAVAAQAVDVTRVDWKPPMPGTDADLATEVTAMTQQQILTQAATSVLAQANSAPQAILKLLQ